jgi:uncharacterized protein (TIGR03437 family)
VRSGQDLGSADAALTLTGTIGIAPSAAQQAELDALLTRQQDPASSDYHRWLTPEAFGTRFGAAQSDIDKITGWLAAQGITVLDVAPSRNAIRYRAPVRAAESAFRTSIHRYRVNGEEHFANATEPSLPAAIAPLIANIGGLHDFRMRPMARVQPAYTSGSGNHYLAPSDLATVYNLKPLYAAGYDGTGQKIAIVGQTQIDLADNQGFRAAYGLPAADPQVMLVPNLHDPGVSSSDLDEANLDIEWSGAAAPRATILYVYSANVEDAATYAVTSNLAPIMSMSYGLCEQDTRSVGLTVMRSVAQQAVAQGMTWVTASGDNGAADCFGDGGRNDTALAVDAPGSIPEVTSVGGTVLTEGAGTFWNAANDTALASALSWIPESVWNDSAIGGRPSSGGGGASVFFSKPDWQTGLGVPADGARDVPDVSFASSPQHDGYLFYSGSRKPGVVGGTSAASPVFAGILAIVNHYQTSTGIQKTPGLGNVNPRLYAMAQSAPGAFHDVTAGNNIVTPCGSQTRNCGATPVGYNAGPGYDLASGLGSIDAFNFVTLFPTTAAAGKTPVTISASASASQLTALDSVTFNVSVSGGAAGTPAGFVSFGLGGVALGSAALAGSAGTAAATFTISAANLAAGAVSVTAAYSGDAVFASGTAAISLTLAPALSGITNAASYRQVYAPGMIGALFGKLLANGTQSAASVPLPTQLGGAAVTIGGISAPLYFVSPGQVNFQIPGTLPPGPAALVLTINGQTVTDSITIAAAAPGIFTDPANGAAVPNESARRGDTITLFVTGEGPSGPGTASVTVGGIPAAITYQGIPSWSIGVMQINYTVPQNASPGAQPVVVTIGSAASPPATLNVTP